MNILRKGNGLIVLLVLCLAAAAGRAEERRPEGRVKAASGSVTVQSLGEPSPRPAVAGDPVFAQDRVTTGPEGRAEITLNDGSLITLRPDSRIEVLDSRANAARSSALLLIVGWLEAVVDPEAGSRLEVQTASAVAGVRGTRFTVAGAADCASRIAVERGQVAVWGHAQKLTLAPDQQLTVDLSERPLHARAAAAGEGEGTDFLAERSRRLVKHAGRMIGVMDREMETRTRAAEKTQQTVAKQFQKVEAAARQADAAKNRPEAYAAARLELKRELELNYGQLRYLQYHDGYMVSCDEMLKQLLADAQDHPGNYSPSGRKRVLAKQDRILGRDAAALHQANLAVIADYAGRLNALAAQYQLSGELTQPEIPVNTDW